MNKPDGVYIIDMDSEEGMDQLAELLGVKPEIAPDCTEEELKAGREMLDWMAVRYARAVKNGWCVAMHATMESLLAKLEAAHCNGNPKADLTEAEAECLSGAIAVYMEDM